MLPFLWVVQSLTVNETECGLLGTSCTLLANYSSLSSILEDWLFSLLDDASTLLNKPSDTSSYSSIGASNITCFSF